MRAGLAGLLLLGAVALRSCAAWLPVSVTRTAQLIPRQSPMLRRAPTQVHMLDRIWRLVAANFNSLLKRFEDPEKIIEQAVVDMQNDLIRIRQSYAEVSAAQKRMEKQLTQANQLSVDWYRRAEVALQSGDEGLAREALQRRQMQLEIAETLAKQLSLQTEALEKLNTSMQALEVKITEARRQKEAFMARARTAKTAMQVHDMLSNLQTSSSMEAFERMKEKVEALETQAEVAGVATDGVAGLEERFAALDGQTAVDRDLAHLKRSLGGTFATPRLPTATTTTAVVTSNQEDELHSLGRRR